MSAIIAKHFFMLSQLGDGTGEGAGRAWGGLGGNLQLDFFVFDILIVFDIFCSHYS